MPQKAIFWAAENGITYGYTTEIFAPNDGCTRAQIVNFLWRANGKEATKSENEPFGDVQTTDYFYRPVLWAVENKITSGMNATTFAPHVNCSRAEAVTFPYRVNR